MLREQYYHRNVSSKLVDLAYDMPSIFLFSTNDFLDINSKNISTSLLWIANFIWNRNIADKIEKDILSLISFEQTAWSFILSIYKAEWNSLKADNHNRIFCQNIILKFNLKN